MSVTEPVVAHIADYLSGDLSVRELRAWAAQATVALSAVEIGAPETAALNRLEHRLAEYTNGDWTEEELRDLLRPLVRAYRTTIGAAPRAKGRRERAQWHPIRVESLAESA